MPATVGFISNDEFDLHPVAEGADAGAAALIADLHGAVKGGQWKRVHLRVRAL